MLSPPVTASQVERHIACPGGALLPRARDPSPAADHGTLTHLRLLAGDLPEPFRSWFPARPEYEAAVVWTPGRPASYLGSNLQRAYPESALPAVAGTADALWPLWARGDRRLWLADLKTGPAQLRGSLPPPGESWQLRTLAALWWALQGRPEDAEVRVAWLLWDEGDETREPEGWVEESPDPFRAPSLREWSAELAALARGIHSGRVRGDFRRGAHCLTCSSFDFCPAQRDVLGRLDRAALSPERVGDMSPETLDDLLLDARAARRQAERAEEVILRAVSRSGGADLPGDMELASETRGRMVVTDPAAVLELAEQMLGRGVGRHLADLRTSPARVRSGLAKLGRSAEADDFVEALEGAGLVAWREGAPRLVRRRRGGGG